MSKYEQQADFDAASGADEEERERRMMSPFDRLCADAMADEIAALVRRGVIDSRSPAADALLDYRNPPSTPRVDRLAQLTAELAEARRERDEWKEVATSKGRLPPATADLVEDLEHERDACTRRVEEMNGKLIESRAELEQAWCSLVGEFVPEAERNTSATRAQTLRTVVEHAVAHHQWHHDAANVDYVRGIEAERDAAQADAAAMRIALTESIRITPCTGEGDVYERSSNQMRAALDNDAGRALAERGKLTDELETRVRFLLEDVYDTEDGQAEIVDSARIQELREILDKLAALDEKGVTDE